MDFMSLAQMHQRAEDPYLPPGFRFHPTDEELVYYLTRKVLFSSFRISAIVEVDLNKCEPWDLPAKATMGEKEWYFYTLRDRKYPTGMRTNRATEAGYWKATGKDRNIMSSSLTVSRSSCLVGMKKTLVFYRGRAPKGLKSNWIMHEYRLEGETSQLNRNLKLPKDSEWVICRIFQKFPGGKKALRESSNMALYNSSSSQVHQSSSLPPLRDDSPRVTVTEEAAGDDSETSQNDQVPSFSENSYSVLKEYSNTGSGGSWGPKQTAAADTMLHHPPTSTPTAPDINMLKVPPYFAGPPSQPASATSVATSLGSLPALETYSSYSSSIAKFRPEFPVQSSQLAPPHDINSLKALDQFSRALTGPYSVAKAGIRACKVEPKTPLYQSMFRPLDMNTAHAVGWLNENQQLGLCSLQLPQQQTFPAAESVSLNELAGAEEVPSNIYRTVASSSSVEMDSLWSY